MTHPQQPYGAQPPPPYPLAQPQPQPGQQQPYGAPQPQVPYGQAIPGQFPPAPGQFPPAPGQVPPTPVPVAPPQPALPVVKREFHEFNRAPRWRWWRGLLALLLMGVLWFAVSMVVIGVQSVIDMALGNQVATPTHGEIVMTPALFLANNVTIALFIPACMIAHRVCVGQKAGYLSSVVGRIRWGWLGTCLAICLPIWAVLVGIEVVLGRGWEGLAINPATWVLLFGILLTTPFQAAGEEYFNRSFLPKIVGGWIPDRETGLIVGAVLSALVFMALHAAADPWLNAFYFCFGLMASIIAWRTGGLEATIAIHVVNNLFSEWNMPFTDISGMMDRSVGQGDWTIAFPLLAIGLAWALMEFFARRRKLVRAAAPGAEAPALPSGR